MILLLNLQFDVEKIGLNEWGDKECITTRLIRQFTIS